MQITIPSDFEAFVAARVSEGRFSSAEQYICTLIRDDQIEAKYEELSAAEMAESLAAIDRGMADVAAGRTKPVREALREIADKLGLQLDR
ncbi:MAG TPA: hypothetical protein VEQ85_16795 [Lacipirellulaceae bacterium]|nr:hypothetical protein [Lacipirellulaceae bacterium]